MIDLFAGPGGLGEGFSTCREHSLFHIALSIEKDLYAHKTLELRAFYRQFAYTEVPSEYYAFLKGKITQNLLYESYPLQAQNAMKEACRLELGEKNHKTIDNKIESVLNNSDVWVLIGGPPCQAYSIVGRARMTKVWNGNHQEKESDYRHFLYQEYLRIINKYRPPVFVMENVKGLLSSTISTGKIFNLIHRDLRNLNYRLYSFTNRPGEEVDIAHPQDFIIKCENYGIPQTRHRVIVLGIRNDISEKPKNIIPDVKTVTVDQVISDLPKIRSGLSKRIDSNDTWLSTLRTLDVETISTEAISYQAIRQRITRQLKNLSGKYNRGGEFIRSKSGGPQYRADWFYDPRLGGICNHSTRGHIPEDLHRYLFAECYAKVTKHSPSLKNFPIALLPKHKNVNEGIAGKFSDRFRVQLSHKPATTITSHISKDGHYFIHPDPKQCRTLTVREAARIQTFPDNYFFVGPRTSQYIQVGNAVPPLLALKLAEVVYQILNDAGIA